MTAQHQVYAEDFKLIEWLVKEKGLAPLKGERLRELADGGIAGCACADGNYSILLSENCQPFDLRQHLLKLNGAGFMLGLHAKNFAFDPEIAKYVECAQYVLETDLREAYRDFKKGTTIWLISHAPHCGKAGKLKLPLDEMILATLRADEHVTRILRVDEKIVIPMLLVDYTPDVKNITAKQVKLYVIKKKAKMLCGPGK